MGPVTGDDVASLPQGLAKCAQKVRVEVGRGSTEEPDHRHGRPLERASFRNAANRLQLSMWPLCVPAQSLRAFMSSIIR
jgi:hypothetical protein